MGKKIEIVEVSARDGLQSEKNFVATSDKLALVKRAIGAGLTRIEVTSFVNPKRVPQMADAEELVSMLPEVAMYFWVVMLHSAKQQLATNYTLITPAPELL